MSKKRITARFRKDGTVRVEVNGVVGPHCDDVAAFLTNVLGEEIATELKPVYFEKDGEAAYCYEPICG